MQRVDCGDSGFKEGGFISGGQIPYGALVARSAEGKVKATPTGTTDLGYLGVALDDEVENRDNPGFYPEDVPVPIKVNGPAKLWLIGGKTVQSGDYVKMAAALGASTENLGVIGPESTKDVKTTKTIGRVIGDEETGDVGSADYDQTLESDAASGQKDIELTEAKVSSMDLVVGDYVVIDDNNAAEINRVAKIDGGNVTMQNTLSNSYTTAAAATAYKLVQVKIILE